MNNDLTQASFKLELLFQKITFPVTGNLVHRRDVVIPKNNPYTSVR